MIVSRIIPPGDLPSGRLKKEVSYTEHHNSLEARNHHESQHFSTQDCTARDWGGHQTSERAHFTLVLNKIEELSILSPGACPGEIHLNHCNDVT